MELSERQRIILNLLIEEYIERAEPISSKFLKEVCNLDVSPATIRNDLQLLTEMGYVEQPHTSAGRIPTNKGYQYFIEITFMKEEQLPDFIVREIEDTKKKINRELQLAQELTKSLTEISSVLDYQHIEEDAMFDILKIIGKSRNTYTENIKLMNELIKKIEDF